MRARVLRLTLSSNFIFELLNKVAIFFLFSSFISSIKRFRDRPRGGLKTAIYFFAFFTRVISSTFLILYIEIPLTLTRLFLEYFIYLFKSYFYCSIYLRNNIISAFCVSHI